MLSFATKCRSSDRLFCFCRIPIRRGGRAFDALLRYEMSVFGSTFLFLQDSYPPRRTSVRCSPSLRNVGLRIDFFVFAGFVSAAADERSMLSFASRKIAFASQKSQRGTDSKLDNSNLKNQKSPTATMNKPSIAKITTAEMQSPTIPQTLPAFRLL